VKVLRDFPHVPAPEAAYPVLAIGVFDGVHRGHQRIFARLFEVAAGRPAAVVTFDPHPRAVLGPPKPSRLLSPLEERLALFAEWPFAAAIVLRFDRSIAALSYADFVGEALVRQLGCRHLVIGFDTRLGRDRAGTPERLIELGAQLGFSVERVAPVTVDGEVVSSTAIRHGLDAGDVETAARRLGRPYRIQGVVVQGAGRGRGLGVPTANLAVPADKLVPADGVYAGRARAAGGEWPAAINIGVAPTFAGAAGRTVEAHLLDFDATLYGEPIELDLLVRLRAEQRFPDVATLVAQIGADIAAVREIVGG
jgi:riboflavin kinase/FMN adenylyltransferase